jgi:hypothetical protein
VVELHPEARKLLEAARAARSPSREDRERVFASLLASVALTAAVPAAAVPSVAAPGVAAKSGLLGKLASSAVWLKAAASVAVLSVASASTFAYVRHRVQPARAVARVAAPVPASSAIPLPEPALPPAPSALLAPAGTAAPSPEHGAPAPSRHAPEGPSAEATLLRRALEARRAGQPQRALELTDEHAEKYPDSALWAERETLRVLSLCDLGRVAAARRSAAQLQYLWSSPFRATLNASCVGK